MCGRFTLRNVDTLKSKYGEIDFEPSYNLAPGNSILMLTDQLKSINWSFTPYWADKPFNLINARSETLNSKPSFENSNRCLIPADGWYEWKTEGMKKYLTFITPMVIFSFLQACMEVIEENWDALLLRWKHLRPLKKYMKECPL